ncbi:hypothetical protein BG006_007074 [Podila minutissima]|uniref:Zn(2)-C6 fungal-type domain-containing protein n=1 Tax=Podila minutissima TaxID=64525 RepID=A0A9P5VL58_9FUNG|nr:hypothetical protein BG006_007074 [Podila minutissima]
MESSESHHPDRATLMIPPTLHPDTNNHNSNFNSNTPLPSSTSGVPGDSTMPLHPQQAAPRVKSAKAHVPSACINCKKAHLACDLSRPCKRCISVGKDDTCRDVEHKKRGRPKLVDKTLGAWGPRKDNSSDPLSDAAKAATLAKTRVKGKYTKSANYKMPKKVNGLHPHASSDHISSIPSAYPSHPEDHASYPSHPEDRPPSVVYRPQRPQEYRERPVSIHSESDHPLEKTYYPQVKQTQELYTSPTGALATLFLTMDFICARVSDESQALWGYHPHDISHKALHSIIASEDQAKLNSLLRMIKDAVFYAASPNAPQHLAHYPFLDSSSPVFYQNRPGIMSSSAPGSSEYTDVLRIRYADGGSDLFNIRLYVGGGLGTDLSRGLSIEHAYVVCIMSRHSVSSFNSFPRHPERPVPEERAPAPVYSSQPNHDRDRDYSDSRHPSKQQPRYSGAYDSSASMDKISLPPIFTGSLAQSSPSSSTPTTPTPLKLSSSTSFTVPLGKPSSNSSALPSLRTGPLHTPRWLYDPEPFGDRLGGSAPHSSGSYRLPTVFAEPFRALSAPMGGFGVSKYLSRAEPTPTFGNIRRHQLPLPSPSQSSQGGLSTTTRPAPRTLQRDLSSSSFGASFAAQSPPSSMKRPLADMADSQDRNRDIDNRHQDHQQHQTSRPSYPEPNPPSTNNIKFQLQTMPPDHPPVDPAGVCPIVHGSQQRERLQQVQQVQQIQVQHRPTSRELEMREQVSKDSSRGPCRWSKLTDQKGNDHGPVGHGYSLNNSPMDRREQGDGHNKGYSDQESAPSSLGSASSCPVRPNSLSPVSQGPSSDGSMYSFGRGDDSSSSTSSVSSVNPFSVGLSSPKLGGPLRRTGSVGRSSFNNRKSAATVTCLSGACGPICRCSGEDEEMRAAKAMDAARKRMSVHSLLC